MTKEDVEIIEKIDEWLSMQYRQTSSPRRDKRFGLATWILGWGVYRTYDTIRHIKVNIRTLQEQNLLQQDQIIELSHYLNITYGHVSSNRYAMTNVQARMAEINKTLIATLTDVKFLKYTVAIVNDVRINLAKLILGIMSLEQNVNAIYEYMRVLSSRQVNPLIIPPDALRKVLAKVKEDMNRNPRLRLPEDPNLNIWNYYTIMKITLIVMDDFLLILLTIPLTDQSLEMDRYKIYNLPTLHPKLKIEFTYQIQGEYLPISKGGLYAAIPTTREIRISETTEGYLCLIIKHCTPLKKLNGVHMHCLPKIKIKQGNIVPLILKRGMLIEHKVWMGIFGQYLHYRRNMCIYILNMKFLCLTMWQGERCAQMMPMMMAKA